MKFRTVVGRVTSAELFDARLEKEITELCGKFDIEDISIATSDMTLIAVIKYSEKKVGSAKASKPKA